MSITIQVAEKIANDIQLLSRVMPSACRLKTTAILLINDDTGVIAINNLARVIAKDIGLSDYSFIVTYASQATNTAGHVELSNAGKEVHIELDAELRNRPQSLLSTLIHEITHKWLHVRKIKHIETIDNERLTDACCVYLGFSDQLIDGYYHEGTKTEYILGQQQSRTTKTTYGYLRRNELLFARKLCQVFLNHSTGSLDISEDAKVIRALKCIARSPSTDRELPGNIVLQTIKDDVVELEYLLHITMKMLDRSVNEVLYESHSMLRERTTATDNDSPNLATTFQRLCNNLANESKHETNSKLAKRISIYNASLSKLLSTIKSLEQDLNRLRDRQEVACPLCRKVLRFKIERERATLRCPNCQYVFPVLKVIPDL